MSTLGKTSVMFLAPRVDPGAAKRVGEDGDKAEDEE
jgi:hypothetical protein